MADLLRALGDVPAERVRLHPAPGSATEKDVVRIHDREGRLFELVDGAPVEKGMGFLESSYAVFLAACLIDFLRRHKLGTVLGADGTLRLNPGLVRIPDVAFISWERLP